MKAKTKLAASPWDHLLHLADELSRRAGEGHVSPAELRTILGSAAEAFREKAEPTEDYASYAFFRFVSKLEDALGTAERGVPHVSFLSRAVRRPRR